MPDINAVEKANKAIKIANFVLWVISLVFFLKCGDWFGGRWYHWIFAFMLAGILNQILAFIVKAGILGAFGLTESKKDEGNG